MALAIVHSRAVIGIDAPAVTVEVHLANGLPAFTIVGLPDAEVRESRERVRAAILQAGFDFPSRRITVNLAPADLPKRSARLDLPIALGVLVASGQLPDAPLARVECVGELSLTGELRAGRGALAIALAVRRTLPRRMLLLPAGDAAEARLAFGPGDDDTGEDRADAVIGLGSLRDACAWLRGEPTAQAQDSAPPPRHATRTAVGADPPPCGGAAPAQGPHGGADLADVRGQPLAKRALEIAAAGGHALLLSGPPGSGKSMLAHRLPGLLPPMTESEALEAAAMASLAGRLEPAGWRRRPMRAPHHSASMAALVGGGSDPRPGEVSLAHHGLLFLDELLEWQRPALEALREPLETGQVLIARAGRHARFPARFQLVAATNPCPCGHLGTPECTCTPERVARYRTRLSGPLLDRIDLFVDVPAQPPDVLLGPRDGETSATVRERVVAARARQQRRQGCANAELAPGAIDRHCAPDDAARALLERAVRQFGLSGRGLHRVLRVARTIADLALGDTIEAAHVAEAIGLRRPPHGTPSAAG